MPKARTDFKRTNVTRLIRAANDAGLAVTGVRFTPGGEIEVKTGPLQNEPADTEARPNTFDQVLGS